MRARLAVLFTAALAAPLGGRGARAEPDADPVTRAARRVAKLRAEVDDLAARAAAERSALEEARRRYAGEARELELAAVRTRARARALRRELRALEAAASERRGQAEAARPALLAAVARLREQVQEGLPFRQAARLRELDELREGLENASLPPDQAASRLWRFIRAERRLAETSGRDRRALPLEDGRTMAEVARLGLIALLFRLPDGRAGYTRPTSEGYRFILTEDPAERAAIEATLDALARGRSPGRLDIPAAALVEAP
jgi:hypothetical protein